jgi:hypothetical protein
LFKKKTPDNISQGLEITVSIIIKNTVKCATIIITVGEEGPITNAKTKINNVVHGKMPDG